MSRSSEDGFASRKLIVTATVVLATTVLAALSKMDANVGLVFSACVAAYNWANVRHHQTGVNNERMD